MKRNRPSDKTVLIVIAVVIVFAFKLCRREHTEPADRWEDGSRISLPVFSDRPSAGPDSDTLRGTSGGTEHSRQRPSNRQERDLWNRRNMTMDGDGDINPADADPTEYDLMQEDPDLYDFNAD